MQNLLSIMDKEALLSLEDDFQLCKALIHIMIAASFICLHNWEGIDLGLNQVLCRQVFSGQSVFIETRGILLIKRHGWEIDMELTGNIVGDLPQESLQENILDPHMRSVYTVPYFEL